MRKILFFLVFCVMTTSLFAVPQAFRYQAVVRDNTGAVVADRDMQIRVHIIYEGSIAPVYTETFATRSNAFGMINLEIGHGTPEGGSSFEDIQWGDGAHFVQLEINIGGTSGGFVNMGRAQLLSVPYALFAANAGASDAGGYWELGPGDLHLRNVNPQTVFIGHGAYPDGWPGSTPARLHVAGSIGLGTLGGGGFLIETSAANQFRIGQGSSVDATGAAFAVGSGNNIVTSNANVFVLGHNNSPTSVGNVLIFGDGNTITGTGLTRPNSLSLLAGRGNQVNNLSIDNILIGQTIISGVDSVIALGTDLRPSPNSIFVGRGIQSTNPLDIHNIVMGHNVDMRPYGSVAARENILIGNDIASPGAPHLFSANRTIAIGNQIHPHGGGFGGLVAENAAHNSVNIGNAISTRSQNSISIGNTITSVGGDVAAERFSNTIAIGRNISFPAATEIPTGFVGSATALDGRVVSNEGAIILGTNFTYLYPHILGRTGIGDPTFNIDGTNAASGCFPGAVCLQIGPRPRFVVGGYSTWRFQASIGAQPQIPIHFLYIDDFANAYFGFTGAGHMEILEGPWTMAMTIPGLPAGSNVISGRRSGGHIFARGLIALDGVATPSDRNLKTNIVSLRDRNQRAAAPRSLSDTDETRFTETLFSRALSNINVYSYNLTLSSADPREQWGFMAQDVFPYFPHLVTTFDGETLSMTYTEFIPILWTIAQDQQAQIEEQQARIIELEERLRRIEAALGLD